MAESLHLYGCRLPAGVRLERVFVPAASSYQPVLGPAGSWVVQGRDGWSMGLVALELQPGAPANAAPPRTVTLFLVGPGLSMNVAAPRFDVRRPTLPFGKRPA